MLILSILKTFCVLPLLRCALAQELTEPLSSTTLVNTSSVPAKNTSLQPWPRQFKVSETYKTRPITVTDTLVLAVQVLVQLGLKHFDGLMPNQSFSNPEYNKVRMDYSTGSLPVSRTRRKYVIWGISAAITSMVKDKKFAESVWVLLWNEQPVGIISFEAQSSNALDAKQSAGELSPNAESLAAGSITSRDRDIDPSLAESKDNYNDLPEPYTVDDISILIDFSEGSLTIFDVFLSIIHLLANVAELDSQVIVRSTAYVDLQCGVVVKYGNYMIPERETPPLYLTAYLMHALGRVPRFMLEKRKFGFAAWVLEINGVPVGDGAILKNLNAK
ncbi:MAG: hypothetical protein Q9163_005737 [Psora crenata]